MEEFFLRIDDVGRWRYQLDSINQLMAICAERKVKLVMSVITGELEKETVNHLIAYNRDNPGLLELLFHGHTHDLLEFSTERNLDEQIQVLHKGAECFKQAFGYKPNGFVPPEHICTSDTINALEKSGFEYISKQFKPTFDGYLFYKLGKLVRRWFLGGKKISYHPGKLSGTHLKEVSISIELAEKNVIKDADTIFQEYRVAKRYTKFIGFLIHPQVLDNKYNVEKFYQFLQLSIDQGWQYRHICN